jgi:hypothetical protein
MVVPLEEGRELRVMVGVGALRHGGCPNEGVRLYASAKFDAVECTLYCKLLW